MFKNMVFKEMNKNEKVKEAALKETRELKRKTESKSCKTKHEFPYHSGGTPISSLAVACHQQHVKRSFSGLCTCCPYIWKTEQKPMIARCGKYCGYMG